MRLLFLVPYVPSEIYVRPYNLMRSLAHRGHDIHLLTLGGAADRPAIEELRRSCTVEVFSLPRWRAFANSALALLSSRPMQADYCWQPALAHHWRTLLGKGRSAWDAVHV